jgi:EpsI family protein
MSARGSVFVIAFLTVLTVYTYALRYRHLEGPPAPSLGSVPIAAAGFTNSTERASPESLENLGADATLFRVYRSGAGRLAWLFIGYFGSQREGSQIHSPKHCYPGAGWNIVEESPARVPFGEGEIPARSLAISDGVRTQYVLYWFSSADGIVTDELALKWNQMKNALLGRPQATAFVRFSTDATGRAGAAPKEDLVRFASALAPRIEDILRPSGAAPSNGSEARPARPDSGTAAMERTP